MGVSVATSCVGKVRDQRVRFAGRRVVVAGAGEQDPACALNDVGGECTTSTAAQTSRWDLADLATTIEAEDNFDLRACAAPIQAATLVISGGRDRFYPMTVIEQTTALIPSSRMMVDPEHGHMTVTGVPAVHEAILDHLDGG